MDYTTISSSYGMMPLAGYVRELINVVQNMDGLDTLHFCHKLYEEVTEMDGSPNVDFCYIGLMIEDNGFCFSSVFVYSFDELVESTQGCDNVKMFKLYKVDEDYGLDVIRA